MLHELTCHALRSTNALGLASGQAWRARLALLPSQLHEHTICQAGVVPSVILHENYGLRQQPCPFSPQVVVEVQGANQQLQVCISELTMRLEQAETREGAVASK